MQNDQLLDCLHDSKVEFIIVRGVAAVLHGSTLLTRDLDICVKLGPENLLRLQTALQPFEPQVRTGSGYTTLNLPKESAEGLENLCIKTTEGRLDCLGSVLGVGKYDEVLTESVQMELGERFFWVIGREALIRAKEAMGRPHDLQTIAQLRATQTEEGS